MGKKVQLYLDWSVRSKTLTGLMSLRKPLGTWDVSSGFLWRKLWRGRHFTYMRKDLVTRTKWLKGSTQWSGIIFSWSEMCVRATHLQPLIKAHFTCQGLADPVDEGFGFLSRVWAGARDLKLHHFTTVILSAKQNIESSSNTETFSMSDAQKLFLKPSPKTVLKLYMWTGFLNLNASQSRRILKSDWSAGMNKFSITTVQTKVLAAK